MSQMADSPRNINSAKPFARAYEAYQERGWLGVIPLPAGQKHPPPVGWTGRNARHPEQDDIDEWLRKVKYKNANIGLHLGDTSLDGPYELIGIDVDNYEDKAGAEQLKRLESEHGKLPATWVSSSRPLPSGIRFYRVPKGYAFIGKASSAIDIVQRAHRYAVVWPSWNPDSDAQYAWFAPDGTRVESLDELPDANTLPILSPDDPDTHGWFQFLTRDGMQDTGEEIDMDMSVNEVFAWAVGNFRKAVSDDDNVCSKMQAAVDHWSNAIDDDESSHDKITGAHWNIIALGAEGHYDWSAALEYVEKAYIKNTLARGKRTVEDLRGEVSRSKINALRKIKAQIDSGKRALSTACSCYTPTEEDLALVAAALKAQARKGKGASPKEDAADPKLATNAEQRERVRAGLDDDDESSADGGGTFPDGMPFGVPKDPGEYSMDDDGNAQHWRDIFKTHAYYIPEYDDWIMWNGMEWIKGEGMARRSYGAVKARQTSYAKQLANVARSLAEADDPRAKSAIALARRWSSWADRSGMSGPKDAALKTAGDHLIMHERELNKDPYTIGVANGVVRLLPDGSVTLNDLRKDDFITLNTGTPYVPWSELGAELEEDATCWEDAVETWLPDEELRLYVQKLLGYSMLGDNRDRICVFLLGTTGTGKSTFLNTIMAALGDYAGPVDLSIFRGDRHTNPALVYALPQRIITASEASQRNILHADVFKRITGGEPISAELKYANEIIKRVPAFVPWVATNAAPSMPGADVAVKRRVRVVPFSQQVVEDTALGVRMRSSKGVATAALSWCIEGWRLYVSEGLSSSSLPTAMNDAAEGFNSDMSDFGQFVAERIIVHPQRAEMSGNTWEPEWCPSVADVYDDYLAWCADNRTPDRNIMQRNWFARQMKDNGFASRQFRYNGENVKRFEGISLRYNRTTKLDVNGA